VSIVALSHGATGRPDGPGDRVDAILSLPPGPEWDDRLVDVLQMPTRKQARFDVSFAVETRLRHRADAQHGLALNISAGGALVAVRRSLPLSARILLEIPSAPLAAMAKLPKASRTLRARSVRVTHAEGYHLLGLKFLRPLLNTPVLDGACRRKVGSVV